MVIFPHAMAEVIIPTLSLQRVMDKSAISQVRRVELKNSVFYDQRKALLLGTISFGLTHENCTNG